MDSVKSILSNMMLIVITATLCMRDHFRMIKQREREQNFMVKRTKRKQKEYFINQLWLKKFKNIMKMALLCKNNNNSCNNP